MIQRCSGTPIKVINNIRKNQISRGSSPYNVSPTQPARQPWMQQPIQPPGMQQAQPVTQEEFITPMTSCSPSENNTLLYNNMTPYVTPMPNDGMGTVQQNPPLEPQGEFITPMTSCSPVENNSLDYENMTAVVQPMQTTVPGTPAGTPQVNQPIARPISEPVVNENPLQGLPTFQVPANPLLPQEYSEVLDYETLQYANGFLRTQIGKYVRIEQLMGSSTILENFGYLIGVGINYIIVQEISTNNITMVDFYSLKNVYIYYTQPSIYEAREDVTDIGVV